MAKRVSPDEKPFNPVEEALTRSVLMPTEEVSPIPEPSPAPSTRVVSLDAHRPPPPVKVETNDEEDREGEELERLTREKRYLLTESEEELLERLVKDMGKRLGTSLGLSNVIRAATSLLMHSRDELLKQSDKMGRLKRPPNGDPAALATFEHNISRIIDRAIRGTRILD